MRVLLAFHSMVTRSNHRLAEELAKLPGVELTVVAPTRWPEESRDVVQEVRRGAGYTVHVLPIVRGKHAKPNLFAYRKGLGRILRQGMFDIIDCYEEPCSLAMAQMLILRALHAPHSKLLFYSAQNILKRYPPPFSWLERWTYRTAAYGHVCNSQAIDVLRTKGYTGPVEVLPLGVDRQRFTPTTDKEAAKATLGVHGPVVGYVGRLHQEKGVRDLLAAFAQLKMPAARLLLVGDGPDRAYLEERAATLGIATQTIFCGSIDRLRVPAYMHAMDCLVVPSRTMPNWKEQYGRIIIEGFLCGIPVVGSDSGSIPELIGTAGQMYHEGDVSALVSSIESLLSQSECNSEIVSKARALAENGFTWEAVAARRGELYRRALALATSP